MKRITDALEAFLDWGGTKKDIALLAGDNERSAAAGGQAG